MNREYFLITIRLQYYVVNTGYGGGDFPQRRRIPWWTLPWIPVLIYKNRINKMGLLNLDSYRSEVQQPSHKHHTSNT